MIDKIDALNYNAANVKSNKYGYLANVRTDAKRTLKPNG